MKVFGESVSVRGGAFTHLGYLAAAADNTRIALLPFEILTALIGAWFLFRLRRSQREQRPVILGAAAAAFCMFGLLVAASLSAGLSLPRKEVVIHAEDARAGFRALRALLRTGAIPPADTGELRRAWGLDPRDLADRHGNDLRLRRGLAEGRETWAIVGAGDDGR